jgi:hypothetical protein
MRTLIQARKAVSGTGGVVKNLRVSDFAIEFDLYVQNERLLDENLTRLSSEISNILTAKLLDPVAEESKIPKERVIEEVRQLFNEQRFWECHETLEQVWRTETGEEKALQQGIILAASAFVHYQRDEPEICISMLKRARDKLEIGSNEKYYAINLKKLKEKVNKIIQSRKIELFTI